MAPSADSGLTLAWAPAGEAWAGAGSGVVGCGAAAGVAAAARAGRAAGGRAAGVGRVRAGSRRCKGLAAVGCRLWCCTGTKGNAHSMGIHTAWAFERHSTEEVEAAVGS
jgi:hypothetical protein